MKDNWIKEKDNPPSYSKEVLLKGTHIERSEPLNKVIIIVGKRQSTDVDGNNYISSETGNKVENVTDWQELTT